MRATPSLLRAGADMQLGMFPSSSMLLPSKQLQVPRDALCHPRLLRGMLEPEPLKDAGMLACCVACLLRYCCCCVLWARAANRTGSRPANAHFLDGKHTPEMLRKLIDEINEDLRISGKPELSLTALTEEAAHKVCAL